jgi:serine/threonine protein kinase
VTELLNGGELLTVLRRRPEGSYTEGDAARIMRPVLAGLAYIHSRGFMHRDLKARMMLADNRQPPPCLSDGP